MILSVNPTYEQTLTPSHLMTSLSRIPWSICLAFNINGACLIFIKEIVQFVMSRLHSVRMSLMRVATMIYHVALVSYVRRALLVWLSLLVGQFHLVHRAVQLIKTILLHIIVKDGSITSIRAYIQSDFHLRIAAITDPLLTFLNLIDIIW